jgi:hypothetical protein
MLPEIYVLKPIVEKKKEAIVSMNIMIFTF